ncbi:MAG: lipid-A-disaccharide synthase [Proteobacteria bacterium]|nr:lipid-A-disaccharide synthase [Pseudomonadota bacterium]
MNGSNHKTSLLVVAGEPSGDRAAARVVDCITAKSRCRMFGIGGGRMMRSGVELVANIDRLTALGPIDTARRLGRWARVWASIREETARLRPRVALLVNAPEINLPLARVLTAAGIRVVFYAGPQVWAWRKSRLGLLKQRTDVVALILPFEKPLYDAEGVRAVFVGHPILDDPLPKEPNVVRQKIGIASHERLVVFLPGSRPGEVTRHSEIMIQAGRRLKSDGIRSVIAPANSGAYERILAQARAAGLITVPPEVPARDLLGAADTAIVASGTATLEAAVTGVPFAIVYRLDPISWLAGRLFVKIPYVGLPNWIAGQQIVPELLQRDFTPDSLYAQVLTLLNPEHQKRQREKLADVAGSLGRPGAADRVAKLVMERLR